VLVDVSVTDLAGGPLNQLQTTEMKREDLERLIQSINKAGPDAISADRLKRAFDTHWPQLESRLVACLERHPVTTQKPRKNAQELLLEDIAKGIQRVEQTVNGSMIVRQIPAGRGWGRILADQLAKNDRDTYATALREVFEPTEPGVNVRSESEDKEPES